MQLTDATTQQLIGHLADISTGGFKLDSDGPIPLEKEYNFHLVLTPEVAAKPFMVFKARSKWSQADPIDPFVYNTGFHLIEMPPRDRDIFNRVVQQYGKRE
ncbi:MAG: PilZ domain-containing protein [Anaerolineae bacterium]|nr:PilZ domain-containing protein [Anaerolineae bacterium]